MRDRAPAGPGVQVDTGQSEGRWNQGRGGLPIGPERLAVQEQLRVELPRSPAPQDRLDGGYVHGRPSEAEQVCDRLQIGRQRRDQPDVKIAVGPSVEPMADARSKRVVHGGVAERTLNADRLQTFRSY